MSVDFSLNSANPKNLGLWLYRAVTSGSRQQVLQKLKSSRRVPIAVLFYHRVADEVPNDWTISRRDFARHLDWLGRQFDVVSLEEAQLRIKSPSNDRPTVAITFDDGYADNCDFAIDELCKRNLPATYFVASDFVRSGTAFPHDVKAGHPLQPNTVDQLRDIASRGIEIGGHTRGHVDLATITDPTELRREIVGNVQQLERWLRKPVRYFAFPYGMPENTSQLAVDLVMQAGLKGFCTAYGAWNWPGNSGVHVRRIHADAGLEALRNWLTLDPRKMRDHRTLPFNEAALVGARIEPPAHECETAHSKPFNFSSTRRLP